MGRRYQRPLQLKLYDMKVIQILGHPITLMMIFLIVLISGEAFGGPYIVYLVLGLPHGADYALTGVAGVV
jgi:hypothetical protein